MKRLALISLFLFAALTSRSQITLSVDSMIMDKWDMDKAVNVPVKRIRENMLIDIDKDLLTLKVSGESEEKSYIEQGYLIDLLEVNDNFDKWLFQGIDSKCVPYSITVDLNAKKLSFVSLGKAGGIVRPIITIYYPIVSFRINKEAIEKHIQEKENRKEVSK